MKVIKYLEDLPYLESGVMAIGFFDGFHVGHRKIVDLVKKMSVNKKSASVVFTFENHPLSILIPDQAPFLISSFDFKKNFLESKGVDYFIAPDFTEEFSKIKPREFLKILNSKFKKVNIVVGSDFRFGERNQGNIKTIKDYALKNQGMEVLAVEPVLYEGGQVSSSIVRKLIKDGRMDEVCLLLGRDFYVENKVVMGDRIANKIGFPTANINIPVNQIVPEYGVYTGQVELEGYRYKALIYVGRKKLNLELARPHVEAYILDFDKNIYDKNIKIFFHEWIRDPVTIKSIEQLKEQLSLDLRAMLEKNL